MQVLTFPLRSGMSLSGLKVLLERPRAEAMLSFGGLLFSWLLEKEVLTSATTNYSSNYTAMR